MNRFFRRWLDKYPDKPLVYMCGHNGVTGVVRADDFDEAVRRMREDYSRTSRATYQCHGAHRPFVYRTFAFSNMAPRNRRPWTGTLNELKVVLEGCIVEERSFSLLWDDLAFTQWDAKYARAHLNRLTGD